MKVFEALRMYAARNCARLLKQHLLGSGKFTFQRWQQTAALVAQEPFLNGSSGNYVEEMYLSWKEDPKSVHRVSYLIICLLGRMFRGREYTMKSTCIEAPLKLLR